MSVKKIPDIRVTAIDVTDDFASRVLETALDAGHTHGIGYWAEITETDYNGSKTSFQRDANRA
jgi:hypothetical protein